MSRLPVVIVEWTDSYRASDGWTPRDESIESGREMISDPITSAGFLVDDTEAGIIVACGYNHHADDVESAMAIPRRSIVSIKTLRPAKAVKS